VYNVRRIVNPITRAELDAVAESWVDAALRLEERDLKMMNWLVRGQQRRVESDDVNITANVRSELVAQAI
jgi:DSF synthase